MLQVICPGFEHFKLQLAIRSLPFQSRMLQSRVNPRWLLSAHWSENGMATPRRLRARAEAAVASLVTVLPHEIPPLLSAAATFFFVSFCLRSTSTSLEFCNPSESIVLLFLVAWVRRSWAPISWYCRCGTRAPSPWGWTPYRVSSPAPFFLPSSPPPSPPSLFPFPPSPSPGFVLATSLYTHPSGLICLGSRRT